MNSFLAQGGGNLNKNFPKIQMPRELPGGMLKLRFNWYIIRRTAKNERTALGFGSWSEATVAACDCVTWRRRVPVSGLIPT